MEKICGAQVSYNVAYANVNGAQMCSFSKQAQENGAQERLKSAKEPSCKD